MERLKSREIPQPEIVSVPSAVELLSNPEQASHFWPAEVANDKEFIEQLRERKKLNDALDTIQSRLPHPDTSLHSALEEQLITEDQVTDLYDSLTQILKNPEYQRLALYIPFELFPSSHWKPDQPDCAKAAKAFKATYLDAWESQLTVHDIRANFVDGDVLEAGEVEGDELRVVKAAHLVPKLVEAGMVDVKDILHRIDVAGDPVLSRSFADTLPVLHDMNLLTPEELAYIQDSTNPDLQSAAKSISHIEPEQNDVLIFEQPTAEAIEKTFQDTIANIESETIDGVTQKREWWLKDEKKKAAIDAMSQALKQAMASGSLSREAFQSITESTFEPLQRAWIQAVHSKTEDIARRDLGKARKFYEHYKERLVSLWSSSDPEIHKVLSKLFSRLTYMGVVESHELDELELDVPNLDGPISENLDHMSQERQEIREMIHTLRTHPTLSKQVYPLVFINGSRVKGYGTKEADIDLSVVIKPDVSFEQEPQIRADLEQIFVKGKIEGPIITFWLTEDGDSLRIRNFSDEHVELGASYLTSNLFVSGWEGEQDAIQELRSKLLTNYFYDDKKPLFGREARSIYIEELERDSLQYRLMHKGYARFRPPYGGIDAAHRGRIDGDSMFWDSGYRHTATKLFANRIFLPKIERTTEE